MKCCLKSLASRALTVLAFGLCLNNMNANEGMWLYSNPPKALLKDKFGFDADPSWYEHLQKSSVRFNSGGSGEFVSADGLILSNHHVGADALQKFGDEQHNYLRDGFYARTHDEEKRCLDLELNVLMSIEDVTARVNAAVKADMAPPAAFAARRSIMGEIEKESLDKTGFRSDVVTLYQGGQYHLYRFKRYTDVRLVFAPEQQIAFFGGDPDNFEYPRFNLDICLFRAYENGKPVQVAHYLKWSTKGVSDGELVFVSGHPGHTSRLLTVAELEYQRDVRMPYALNWLHRLEVLLTAYSGRSEENARRSKDLLFGIQNSRKARTGMEAGLMDPALMTRKKADEARLREVVSKKPELKGTIDAWDRIAEAQKVIHECATTYNLIEGGQAFNSTLFGIGRTLLRAGEERPKASGERLREFRDSARESLELELFSEEPLYDDFEQLKLADSLTFLAEQLGFDHPIVQTVLAGKSPRQRASELVLGTKLKDAALRRKLYDGGMAAVAAAKDPMIQLATLVDSQARALRKIMENQDEIKRQAYAKIADAKFAIEGANSYPDATFTLRLAFGEVKGFTENGVAIPFQTTLAGLYTRADEHKNAPPFDLPQRWIERKSSLDLTTPFNFISTADIIGGNSGSPVVNRAGEFVGIIFDGNIQSLVLDYVYTDEQARAVSVNAQPIIEALKKVYDAPALADELLGKNGKK